jgi:hypothetical protein
MPLEAAVEDQWSLVQAALFNAPGDADAVAERAASLFNLFARAVATPTPPSSSAERGAESARS